MYAAAIVSLSPPQQTIVRRFATAATSTTDIVMLTDCPRYTDGHRVVSMGFDVAHVTKAAVHEIVIAVHGSLDRRIGPTLQRTIAKLALRGCDRVLLDLRELHEIDAAGLQVVEMLHERCMAAGTTLHMELRHSALCEVLMRSEAFRRASIPAVPRDGLRSADGVTADGLQVTPVRVPAATSVAAAHAC